MAVFWNNKLNIFCWCQIVNSIFDKESVVYNLSDKIASFIASHQLAMQVVTFETEKIFFECYKSSALQIAIDILFQAFMIL